MSKAKKNIKKIKKCYAVLPRSTQCFAVYQGK